MSENSLPRPNRGRNPAAALLAWLLRVDLPAPQRTEGELRAEVERNYRWNFTFNVLDGIFFLLGTAFFSSTTILPLFISKLTTAPLAFGLLAMIAQAGWFLPQLFTANLMERLARKKPVVVNLGLFTERLPMWVIVLAALSAARSPVLGVVLLLVGYAWHIFGAGVVAVSWQDLIARCFPVDRRGRFFGFSAFVGAGMGALGAALSTWLLQRYAFPQNFVYTFLLAAIMITLSWVFLAQVREPVQPASPVRRSSLEYLASLPDLIRQDRNFRRFLITRLIAALGNMGTGFITVSAVTRWQVPDRAAGIYTLLLLIGQTAANLTCGFLADRRGHKLSLELGSAVTVAAFVLAWLAPGAEWYYPVFLLIGVASGALLVSGTLIVMEFSEPDRRPTYVGIANTAVGLISLAGPLLGAFLAEASYGWLFAVSALLSGVAFAGYRWWVREPRQEFRMYPASRVGNPSAESEKRPQALR